MNPVPGAMYDDLTDAPLLEGIGVHGVLLVSVGYDFNTEDEVACQDVLFDDVSPYLIAADFNYMYTTDYDMWICNSALQKNVLPDCFGRNFLCVVPADLVPLFPKRTIQIPQRMGLQAKAPSQRKYFDLKSGQNNFPPPAAG